MTMLDVKYIKNANPKWARMDLGPLAALTSDIKQHGIVTPLLVKPDFLMIDGARRFTVALSLKEHAVPVTIIDSWELLVEHFKPAALDALPMEWLDLLGFFDNVLKPIYDAHRYQNGVVTRRHNEETGEASLRHGYSAFTHCLAQLYGTAPSTIKLLRDYFVKLHRTSGQFPVFYKGLLGLLPTGEAARDLAQSRFIKSLLERLMEGSVTEEEALTIFSMRLRQGTARRSYERVSPVRFDPQAKQISHAKVDNLLTKLEEVAFQATEFLNFSVTPEELAELQQRITTSLSQIMGLRRRMETATRNQEKSK